jgi:hypothetical protein
VHHATAASGKQDVSVAPALQAGPGAQEEAVSQLINYELTRDASGTGVFSERLEHPVFNVKR